MSIRSTSVTDATRRRFLAVVSAAGLGQTLLPGALLALAMPSAAQTVTGEARTEELPKITPEMIEQAAVIAGVTFTAEQRVVMVEGLTGQREDVFEVRKLALPNSVAPSLVFDPVPPGMQIDTVRRGMTFPLAPNVAELTARLEAAGSPDAATEVLAFATLRELAALIFARRLTSTTLTKMYLARLKRLDPKLHCVITLTEERALKQAAARDAELARDMYRGPLHGIPWGGERFAGGGGLSDDVGRGRV